MKFAYPTFCENSDEYSEKRDPEASVEDSIDNDNVLWWEIEVDRDIWSKARIAHHLDFVNQHVLGGAHWVPFEARRLRSSMRNALKKRRITRLHIQSLWSKLDEDSIHSFKPLFVAFTVHDFHSCPFFRSRIIH